ncbi:MAG: 23S rRNA (adenine(2030)-N(6))-methyltransferase RlmJ [Treponema sp.]|jgi:23S rRNA (adenine2030-N6)-methyltransferase|nr:23S rRNA (adenine(2030)-N(6))-methyltransferase RlmJ [Treponema sp.]
MLGYRHGFHAGNPADVLKHSALVFCLDYLTRKAPPLLCVDTHAGRGLYRLDEGFAAKNREWERGVGRLRRFRGPLPALLESYLAAAGGRAGDGALYPGSPELFRRLLRGRDRCRCFELHPSDFAALSGQLREDRRFRVVREDGFAGLPALLPPPSRRGLILIDPSYETREDFRRLPDCLSAVLRRFSTGTYLIWYPLLRDRPESLLLPERLMELYEGSRCRVERYEQSERSPRGMYGSGLVIYNPPWTLVPALEEALSFLEEKTGTQDWSVRREG